MNEVQYIPIDDVIPYENNPRDNDAAVDAVAASIDEFGFQQPLVCDKDMVLVVGHTRLKAAKRLGYTQVPVVVASELTDEQIRAYRLADNKTNELASWDYELLDEELDAITGIDMSMFGFIQDAVDEVVERDMERAEVPFSLELGQQNNYIVLVFNNDVDWINAQSVFNIGQRKRFSTRKNGFLGEKMQHCGVGRVIDGAEAINALLGE